MFDQCRRSGCWLSALVHSEVADSPGCCALGLHVPLRFRVAFIMFSLVWCTQMMPVFQKRKSTACRGGYLTTVIFRIWGIVLCIFVNVELIPKNSPWKLELKLAWRNLIQPLHTTLINSRHVGVREIQLPFKSLCSYQKQYCFSILWFKSLISVLY